MEASRQHNDPVILDLVDQAVLLGIRRDQTLPSWYFSGWGLPVPSNGVRRTGELHWLDRQHGFDRGGGIAIAQKSTLNASLLHTACNSRAIRPSQRHIRVTHNPWVAGSTPARPTKVSYRNTRHP